MKKKIAIALLSFLCACSCAFGLVACASNNNTDNNGGTTENGGNTENGSDKDITQGNYEAATAEEVNAALSGVSAETILGDVTAADYKFGIDFSGGLNFSMTGEGMSNEVKMIADYKMLIAKDGEAFADKGAGNFSMMVNSSSVIKDDANTTSSTYTQSIEIGAKLYQESAVVYTDLNGEMITSSMEAPDVQAIKAKVNMLALMSEYMPYGVTYATDATGSSMDIITVLNMLGSMGADVSMDTTSGVKLKISIDEAFVTNLVVAMAGIPAESVAEVVSFTKCSMDLYIAIDENGMLSATTIAADVEATVKPDGVQTVTIILNGNLAFKVDSTVTPEVPAGIANDETYVDMTEQVGAMIQNVIGGGSSSGGSSSSAESVVGKKYVCVDVSATYPSELPAEQIEQFEAMVEEMRSAVGSATVTFNEDGTATLTEGTSGTAATWEQFGDVVIIYEDGVPAEFVLYGDFMVYTQSMGGVSISISFMLV